MAATRLSDNPDKPAHLSVAQACRCKREIPGTGDLESEPELQIDPPLIASGRLRTVAAGNSGGFEAIGRSERSVRSVQVFMVEDVARVDRDREIVTVLGHGIEPAMEMSSSAIAAAVSDSE